MTAKVFVKSNLGDISKSGYYWKGSREDGLWETVVYVEVDEDNWDDARDIDIIEYMDGEVVTYELFHQFEDETPDLHERAEDIVLYGPLTALPVELIPPPPSGEDKKFINLLPPPLVKFERAPRADVTIIKVDR